MKAKIFFVCVFCSVILTGCVVVPAAGRAGYQSYLVDDGGYSSPSIYVTPPPIYVSPYGGGYYNRRYGYPQYYNRSYRYGGRWTNRRHHRRW